MDGGLSRRGRGTSEKARSSFTPIRVGTLTGMKLHWRLGAGCPGPEPEFLREVKKGLRSCSHGHRSYELIAERSLFTSFPRQMRESSLCPR